MSTALVGLTLVVMLCAAAQWFAPERTVGPLAERFLCDGTVRLTEAGGGAGGILTQVECMYGLRSEDQTALAFAILAIPCGLVVLAGSVLAKRFMAPKPRTHIQRAHA